MQTSYSHKRSVSITLELEVYDDFDHRNLDFEDLLDLEPGETVDVNVRDFSDIEVMWQ